LKRHVDVTLGRGKIYDAVKLPEGEDVREWLAVNTVDMYNAVSVLYMTLLDICTDATCPTMSAGSKVSLHHRKCVLLVIRSALNSSTTAKKWYTFNIELCVMSRPVKLFCFCQFGGIVSYRMCKRGHSVNRLHLMLIVGPLFGSCLIDLAHSST
jgi:hypothetical protein